MKGSLNIKRDFINSILIIIILFVNLEIYSCSGSDQVQQAFEPIECPEDFPIFDTSTGKCILSYCTDEEFKNNKCKVTNPTIKKQWIADFLYTIHDGSSIYSSSGRSSDGDIFLESSLGNPHGTKKIFTLKSNGREYIDGIRINTINSGSNLNSQYGDGVIAEINEHKLYVKLSKNESIEVYDFDDKKYTSAKLEDILGHKIQSYKNSLLITSEKNTFIYAYITTGNYLIMQKFKIVSNEASNCIQLIATLKENVKTIPKDSRRCMITTKQYIECLDMDENQMYVIRIYDNKLNFLQKYELEKNNAPLNKAIYSYHETVWLKDEISIFVYYIDTFENNAKPILVLKNLSVKKTVTLTNLNSYLTRDIVYENLNYKFSDTENSLGIFNSYYFGLASLTENNEHLIVTLFNIFNSDKTIDTHYFDIPLKGLYNMEYESGLRAFGYKNSFGIQMNYLKNNEHYSASIVFGYANTTDPAPINNLFAKYDSYTIKIKDYYKGIENNIFCYVLVNFVVTEIPNSNYFTVKNKSNKIIKKGSTLSLDDQLTIYKVAGKTIPKGRYVLAFAPYLNEENYEGFIECSSGSDMFGEQIPTKWVPDEYYGRTVEFKFTSEIDCFENCDTCTTKGLTLDDQKCDTCKSGFYFVENTKNCFGEAPEEYYYDRDKKIYSKCYESCKICLMKNEGNSHNCFKCKDNYLMYNQNICLNCKYSGKYVNYQQTDCIDSIPDGYYVNDTEYNTIDKCHKNCLTCSNSSTDDENMNCLTCDNSKGFYMIENKNNCVKIIAERYYFYETIFKQCSKECLTCSGPPITNSKGIITNMNCDTCDESKGYYLIPGTKNCEDINKIDDENNCPKDKPISKNGRCVLEHCTEEEYESEECIISNPIVKKQKIDSFPYTSEIDKPFYSTLGQVSNNEIIFEANIGNPFSERKIYTLTEDGRGYFNDIPYTNIDLNSSYYSTYGNAAIVNINNHKCFLRLSYHETIELYDLDEEKYTSAKLEEILGYKVESYKNSLLKTNEENTFIYAYITIGNYLIMQKFKVVTNDAKDCIQIIKTSLESFRTLSKNSRRCTITKNQYIECIEMTESQIYIIRVYDNELNFLAEFELEKNNAPSDRAFYTYHEAVWLKDEVTIFVYFNDISEKNSRPVFILKKLVINNGDIDLVNFSSYIDKEKIYYSLPYFISDSENSISIMNVHSFALASITYYESSHLLITVFKLLENDDIINAYYYDIPIKDLYDINYYGNLKSFGYKNGFGVQFDHKKGLEYRSGYILFGYGNTTDPEPVKDIFKDNESYKFKPYDYIKIENNVFCYVLSNIIITDLPKTSSGIEVLKSSDLKQLEVGDIISIEEEIIIKYNGNKDDIPRGKYIVGFKPLIKEPSLEEYTECATDIENFGKDSLTDWIPEEFYGRTSQFEFTMGECFKNCRTCKTKGNDLNEQKCETCLEDYYFIENTNNCFEEPPEGYFFNEEKRKYSKCYDNCRKCTKNKIGNTQNCLSCYNNYLLYQNTNCLNCKYNGKYVNYEQTDCIDSIPDGYYVNDTEFNTIDKCHKNCLTCSKSSTNDDNMNCLTCDNSKEFYMIENTNNCIKAPYPGYYVDNNTLRKCNIACSSCSEKAIINENGEVTNCQECNNELGFYNVGETKICRNKTKEGEYLDKNCNCYKPCYKDCLTCSNKEINKYKMNCLSCDESKGFIYYPKTTNCLNCESQSKIVNDDQNECIEKEPETTQLISETTTLIPETTTLNPETNILNPETAILIPETTILNPETTSLVPKTTSLVEEETITNKVILCHKNCLTCLKEGTDDENNCQICMPGLYKKNGNCIKSYVCPYKFFYQIKIDKYADLNQKICLEKNEVCPCALPFYYTNTNECVENCPIELLLYQGCKISNLSYGLNKLINSIKLYFSIGMINQLAKSFSFNDINNLYNIVIKLSVYSLLSSFKFFRNLEKANENIYQSLSDDNLTSFKSEDYFNDSDIDLGPCEDKLRKYYNISEIIHLTIIKIDFKTNESSINNVQYEVFNPLNRTERLDLSICEKEKVFIKNPIENSFANKISYVMGSSNENIFSEGHKFYNDECYIFTSEYGTDVLLQDRKKDYNFKNKICQHGCQLKKYNSTTQEALCSCEPNKGFIDINNINLEEIMINDAINSYDENDDEYFKENQKYSAINGKFLKCSKNIGIGFIKNYVLVIYTLLLIGYISNLVIFFFKYWRKGGNKNISNPPRPKNKNYSHENRENKDKIIKEKSVDIKGIDSPSSNDRIMIKKKIKTTLRNSEMETFKPKNKNNTFLNMLISSIKEREIIFSIFVNKNNILILLLSFINYFSTNTFFFTEINIHQIYIDRGKYNFGFQFKYIIGSVILSSFFLYLSKYFYSFNKLCNKNNFNKYTKKKKIFLYISICLFIFYWVYIGSITSTYINIQNHLIINIILTFIYSIIFELFLAIISAALRKIIIFRTLGNIINSL